MNAISRLAGVEKRELPGASTHSCNSSDVTHSPDVFVVTPEPFKGKIDWSHPMVADVHQPWNMQKFAVPRPPLVIGKIRDRAAFKRPLPGDDRRDLTRKVVEGGYPFDLSLIQFQEAIGQIISFEHAINPYASQYDLLLAVDQSRVSAGGVQRNPVPHLDFYHEGKVKRFYVVSDCIPTVFYNQSFSLNPEDDPSLCLPSFGSKTDVWVKFNKKLAQQASPASEWRPEPFDIVMGDSYTLHRGGIAKEDTDRTFLRIMFMQS